MKRRPAVIALIVIVLAALGLFVYLFASSFRLDRAGNFQNEDMQAVIDRPISAEREILAEVLPESVKAVLSDMRPSETFSRKVRITHQGDSQSLTRAGIHYKNGEKWRTQQYDNQLALLSTAVSDGENIYITSNSGSSYRGILGDSFTADSQLGVADLTFFLNMPESDIKKASLEHLDGESVIFIECDFPELQQTERYWVSLIYGVVLRAETLVAEKLVYQFETTDIDPKAPQDNLFELN